VIAEVRPADWNALLAELGFDDAYLRREYVESAAVLDAGRPVLLATEDAVFAGIVRDLGERKDVTGPYGFGGPVARDAASAGRFYEEYDAWSRENGVVTTFTWFHPRFANHRYARIHVEPRAGTVAWRLDEGDVFERLHRHHRRAARKAEGSAEVRVTVAPAELDAFARLYEQTMVEKGAQSFYYFPPEYWRALPELLGDGLVLFEALGDGELRAALLGLATAPWLHYHLGASERSGGANNLLFLEAARWAQQHGFTRFHLGGGVGGADDTLLEFKLRFDPGALIESAVGKAIHDPEAYRELAGPDAGLEGFFPAYRAATVPT
jgi:serine/alanine adding enzyme